MATPNRKPAVVLDKKQVFILRKAVLAIENGAPETAEAYLLGIFTISAGRNVAKYLADAKATDARTVTVAA